MIVQVFTINLQYEFLINHKRHIELKFKRKCQDQVQKLDVDN